MSGTVVLSNCWWRFHRARILYTSTDIDVVYARLAWQGLQLAHRVSAQVACVNVCALFFLSCIRTQNVFVVVFWGPRCPYPLKFKNKQQRPNEAEPTMEYCMKMKWNIKHNMHAAYTSIINILCGRHNNYVFAISTCSPYRIPCVVLSVCYGMFFGNARTEAYNNNNNNSSRSERPQQRTKMITSAIFNWSESLPLIC